MVKRIFIVHCWGGNPDTNWYPWLAKKLKGQVHVLAMPDPSHPKIQNWVSTLSRLVGKPDENTYFIGHSIGCQTILRYLETTDAKIGGVVLVAGWLNLLPASIENSEDKKIAEPWLKTAINFEKVKNNANKIIALFSDNDPYVPLSDAKLFEQKLNVKTIIEHQKGHYTDKEIPSILRVVREIIE